MTTLTAIADDLTGACDVAAELAAAGHRVRVAVESGRAPMTGGDGIPIFNTQSRALDPGLAYARVRDALRERRSPVVLKKIDTALRGHLGAELDGAIDALGAPAFVLAAIPAAGRVTRGGCQWFGGRLLAATEFARDPEGPGPESSIPAVVARESRRRATVIGRELVRAGRLEEVVATGRRAGVEIFVVDAETEADVEAAVAAILALPRPLCLAGSIALAAALASHVGAGAGRASHDVATPSRRASSTADVALPLPALIVSGSLHSRARAQLDAVVATGLAVAIALPAGGAGDVVRVAATARQALTAGLSVVLTPAAPASTPTSAALRATERLLADLVTAIAEGGALPALVLIGGETSHAVLSALQAGTLEITGRVAPLIARGMILAGAAVGTAVVTKGGSGGEPDAIARLVAGGCAREALHGGGLP